MSVTVFFVFVPSSNKVYSSQISQILSPRLMLVKNNCVRMFNLISSFSRPELILFRAYERDWCQWTSVAVN